MRAFLEEPNSGRFRVSDTELPVVEKQLQIVPALSTHITKNSSHVKIANLPHNDNSEIFSYFIQLNHFKITQSSNDVITLIINPIDSLYFENGASGIID